MKIIKTLWRILNIVHQVRKKSSCSTSRRSLRRLRCSQQVRTGTGIIHGWRGSHWSEEFYDIYEIQKFDWKNVFSLALTCLQSACLSNEHAPPARKFQKQTQRYMEMPENFIIKSGFFWHFLINVVRFGTKLAMLSILKCLPQCFTKIDYKSDIQNYRYIF